jgi:cell division protein FtsW
VKRPWRRPARAYPLEHQILLTATLCLMAGGAVMVYSASSARTLLEGTGDGSTYLVKYLMYGALGLVLMQVMARRGLELAQRFGPIMLVISFALLVAVKLPGLGVEVNGARRWIGAGPLQFQPSEIMKLSLVLYAASLLAGKPKRLQTLKGVISPLLLVAGAAALLIASQPDLGTALVIGFTMSAMLVAAGMPMRHLATLGAGVAGLIFLFALLEPYRRARLTSFLDPWAHASDAGFQAVQGQIALGSGGLFGLGPGQSVQKIFYLPEAHTDFILAVIGEELGVVGVTVLMFLYGMIAYGGLRAAKAAKTAYAQLVAAGVTSLILSQALLNTFTVLGLAPLTGVPLPFVSAGSTSITVLLAGMGLLLNIASGRHTHLRAVPSGSRDEDSDRHRRGRHGGARGARPGGRRRAAG